MEFKLTLIAEIVPSKIFNVPTGRPFVFERVDASSIVQILPNSKNKKHLYIMEVVNGKVYSLMLFKAKKENVKNAIRFRARGGKFTLNYKRKHFFLSTKNIDQSDLDKYDEDDYEAEYGEHMDETEYGEYLDAMDRAIGACSSSDD